MASYGIYRKAHGEGRLDPIAPRQTDPADDWRSMFMSRSFDEKLGRNDMKTNIEKHVNLIWTK